MHECNSMSVDRCNCSERRREKDEDGGGERESAMELFVLFFPRGRSSSHSPDHR